MAVVEFDYSELKEQVDLSKEEMVETLSGIGAPSEEKEGKIIIELTPNRPDLFSKEGIVRAIKSYLGKEIGLKEYLAKKSDHKVYVDPSVKKIRPHTVCAVIKGIRFDDKEIENMVQLQDKLNATLGRKGKKFGIGFYPLENIVFPVSYTTMKPEDIKYHPLNYPHEATAKEILAKHPKGAEYGHLLAKAERYPVFLDGNKKIMCLIPIVNSQETGKVTTETKEVFVEVTGTDKNTITVALNIICCTYADAGGEIHTVTVVDGKKPESYPKLEPKKMNLNLKYVNKILGTEITATEMKKYLERMGYGVEKNKVLIPCYRADIIHQVDLIEDVAIAYGYNDFEPSLPNFFSKGELVDSYSEEHEILRGMGFDEIRTYILKNRQRAMLSTDGKLKEVLNPCTEDFQVIRNNLITDILEVFSTNRIRGLPQKIYEVGQIYEDGKTKTKIIFGVMDKKVDFSIFRGYLQTLMFEKRINFYLQKSIVKSKVFEIEECGEIKTSLPKGSETLSKQKPKGIVGKVDKKMLLNEFGVEFPVYICEFCYE